MNTTNASHVFCRFILTTIGVSLSSRKVKGEGMGLNLGVWLGFELLLHSIPNGFRNFCHQWKYSSDCGGMDT